MGELRLYAIGIDEVRDMFGASTESAERLRSQADQAFARPQPTERTGLLSKLGPIFRRVPGTPVLEPGDPLPEDLDRILSGAYVPAERALPTWRILEVLIKENSWGTTRLPLGRSDLDSLDFALARGGVHAAAGLWHLLHQPTQLPLIPPAGLQVGYHSGEQATWMAHSYRESLPEIEPPEHQEVVYRLANWLDGFLHWADIAPTLGRPAPDLLGFGSVE
jgi:hypothetical protein